MRTGEIYLWQTNKATGHALRYKYHLYIGKDVQQRNVFLFIGSQNYYNECFELKKEIYDFFTKPCSYISCGVGIVYYTDAELGRISCGHSLGELTLEDKISFIEHVGNSQVMELRAIKFIVEKLKDTLN